MKIVDLYIGSRFILRLVQALIAGLVVFIAVDNVENLDKFIDSGVPLARVGWYYLLYVPYILNLVLPVATLLATLFTIGGLASSNELTALRAGGIPFGRLLVVLVLLSLGSAIGSFLFGEAVVPAANRERMDIYRYEVRRIPRETRSNLGRLYFQFDRGRQFYIDRYQPATREAYGVELVESDSGRITRRLLAEKMVWRSGRWWLEDGRERQFQSEGMMPVRMVNDTTLILPGLDPEELSRVQTAPEELNYRELKEFIARLKQSGGVIQKWEVDRHSKVALPAAAVIIVLFGAPIAAMPRRRSGVAIGFGLALFICFIYYGLIQTGRVLGYGGTLPPMISAWAGNVLFGILGIGVLFFKSR